MISQAPSQTHACTQARTCTCDLHAHARTNACTHACRHTRTASTHTRARTRACARNLRTLARRLAVAPAPEPHLVPCGTVPAHCRHCDATAAWYCALLGAFPELQVCGRCSTLPVFPDWRGSFVRAAARTSGRRKRGRTCRTTRTCAACASAWSTYSAASACRSVGPTPHEGKCGRPHATPRHPPTDRCVWRLWLKSGHQ